MYILHIYINILVNLSHNAVGIRRSRTGASRSVSFRSKMEGYGRTAHSLQPLVPFPTLRAVCHLVRQHAQGSQNKPWEASMNALLRGCSHV